MVKAIFFDFGDTLVDEHLFLSDGWHHMLDFLIRQLHVEKNRSHWLALYRSHHAEIYKEYSGDMPAIREKKIKMEGIRRLIQTMGGRADPELADQAYRRLIEGSGYSNSLFKGAYPLLERLSQQYKLAIVSNGLADYTILSLDYLGIAGFFSPILISEQTNCEKPGTEIFDLALHRTGVRPGEALMVGNLLEYDVLGAQRSGIRSVWLQHKPQWIGDVVPDYTIHDLTQLQGVVDRLTGQD